jgi:hypothetical protein
VFICVLAAGCSLGSGAASSARADSADNTARLAHYRGHGIAFDYPAAWGRHRRAGFYTTMTSPIVDLSTQPTVDPCAANERAFRAMARSAVATT